MNRESVFMPGELEKLVKEKNRSREEAIKLIPILWEEIQGYKKQNANCVVKWKKRPKNEKVKGCFEG